MRQKPMAAAPVSLVQNLEDAGCGPELVKEFLALKETGDVNGQMRLLRIHRQCLLDEVHTGEKRGLALQFNKIRGVRADQVDLRVSKKQTERLRVCGIPADDGMFSKPPDVTCFGKAGLLQFRFHIEVIFLRLIICTKQVPLGRYFFSRA